MSIVQKNKKILKKINFKLFKNMYFQGAKTNTEKKRVQIIEEFPQEQTILDIL